MFLTYSYIFLCKIDKEKCKLLVFIQQDIAENDVLHEFQIAHTVNSRKYRTLFINYDFRWLMVAEI